MRTAIRRGFERHLARYSRSPFPVSVLVAHVDKDGNHIRGWGLDAQERRVLSTYQRHAVYVSKTMTLREAGVVRSRGGGR